jgi:hypothetical protein
MKPGGLERVRIGRETRQGMLGQQLGSPRPLTLLAEK